MLFRLWGGVNFRSTEDLDWEGFLQDKAEVVPSDMQLRRRRLRDRKAPRPTAL
jgi:hypothetical protein